jgi:hypothetical protein
MAKQKYRITNWSEYNSALKKRGSLTLWIEEGFEKTWYASAASENAKRGRPLVYSDTCIKLMATIRHIFKLALRQLEGFLTSLFSMLKIELRVPEFSRISRRMAGTLSSLSYPAPQEPIHLVIDSSGLKVYGEKEWIKTKHGKEYSRRVWRKIHIGVDGKGIIRASKMTTHKTDDRACFSTLIDQVGSFLVDETLADSGYDSHNCYHQCEERNIVPLIPPPKSARVSSRKGKSVLRNQVVSYIKEKGIHAWKEKNNFGRRNRVENTFYRIKTIFGRQFISRVWKNQEAEINLICHLLNKMTSFGMPCSVKAA